MEFGKKAVKKIKISKTKKTHKNTNPYCHTSPVKANFQFKY